MKKLLVLINHEFSTMAKQLTAVIVLLPLLQWVLLAIAARSVMHYIPYEEFFAASGAITIFFLAFAAVSGICIMSMMSNYTGSKSIYTLMTLPQDRRKVYFSKLTAGTICFLVLVAVQLISAVVGYYLFAPKIVNSVGTQIIWENAVNGLFLAFVRSHFFRMLLPLGLEALLSTAVILISFICGLYYAILCERAGRYGKMAFAALHLGYLVFIINYRVNASAWNAVYRNLYIHSAVLLLFTAFFIWDGICFVRKSRIS